MSQSVTPLDILLRAFPGIPEDEAQELITSGEVHIYAQHTVLCQEDAQEFTFYIILDGSVQVTKVIDKNQVRLLKTLGAGDFFGEMAIIHDAPRAATVTTTAPTTVLEIRKEAFNKLLRTSASLSRAMVHEVSRRLRENDAMAIEDLRLKAGELADAYQQLAEQEYARREFLTMIAHELRTPLTAASGFLQILQMATQQGQNLDSEMLKGALVSASRNIQQIVTLVNDILFVQEMDLILPRFVDIDLRLVLAAAIDAFHNKMSEQQVSVDLQVPDDLPLVPGDAKSLERAFSAILDNAIKYSPSGETVEIRAGCEDNQVWVEIEDHGVGIPEEALPHIFDRFFHIDQIGGRVFRGVGLGLSIARQVIEQHQGSIGVESEFGKGSTIRVTLNRK